MLASPSLLTWNLTQRPSPAPPQLGLLPSGGGVSCVIPCLGALCSSVCSSNSRSGFPFLLPALSWSFLRCTYHQSFLNAVPGWFFLRYSFDLLFSSSAHSCFGNSLLPLKMGWFSRLSNLFYFPCHCLYLDRLDSILMEWMLQESACFSVCASMFVSFCQQ